MFEKQIKRLVTILYHNKNQIVKKQYQNGGGTVMSSSSSSILSLTPQTIIKLLILTGIIYKLVVVGSSSSSDDADEDNQRLLLRSGGARILNGDGGSSSSSSVGGNIKKRTLPSVLIIGARKCGTRALIDMLNLHPQVEKAQSEVHFFDRDENYEKGLDWYESQMPEITDNQISIEKSPSYFVTPEVPERVYGMNSTIKLLLIVREPVTRVISDYTQIYYYSNSSSPLNKSTQQQQVPPPPPPAGSSGNNNNNNQVPQPPPPPPPPLQSLILHQDGSINTNYKAIRVSIYSRYLQRWVDIFPTSQIHVIDGDALIRDPFTQLQQVEKFLGLEGKLKREDFYFNSTKGFYCWKKRDNEGTGGGGTNNSSNSTEEYNTVHCLNDSKGRKHPNVDRRLVKKLRGFYRPFNQMFYDQVGRDFGWPES